MCVPPTSGYPRSRAARPQAVLTVRHREQLNAHTVRVIAGGEGFARVRQNEFTDKYAKVIFVDPELGLVPPYDLPGLRESLPAQQRPVTRTYTVRRVEADLQQLTLDFVMHGAHGIAAPWAAKCHTGDTLTISGAGGAYRPDPSWDWHLFVGDESALPAISAAVETLPRNARGLAYLETSDDAGALDCEPPSGLEIRLLHRPHPGATPQLLADAIVAGPWLNGRVGVFAHGERESMKAVRGVLKPLMTDDDVLSLSGYWAYGRTEDVFQAEKREPIGQID
jgi:NADPH-dependent ferric siderophore reductase